MNYQSLMEQIIKNEEGNRPTLLLHVCCAPCSSYVLETLSKYFKITILYYNPNIYPYEEFEKRYNEAKKLIKEMPVCDDVKITDVGYDNDEFENVIEGLKDELEGGKRCFKCYEIRLRKTAEIAKENNFDYFTTSLSISPYKNANKLNEIGESLEKEYNIKYLYADFKKKNGYKRSIELSNKYNLYRQDYCGCIYSKEQRNKKILEKQALKN